MSAVSDAVADLHRRRAHQARLHEARRRVHLLLARPRAPREHRPARDVVSRSVRCAPVSSRRSTPCPSMLAGSTKASPLMALAVSSQAARPPARSRGPAAPRAPSPRRPTARCASPGSARSSTTASPAAASHCGETNAPMPMRAMGSGTSVTSIGPSASAAPLVDRRPPGAPPCTPSPRAPCGRCRRRPACCIGRPTLRATQLAMTCEFAPVSTSIHIGSPRHRPVHERQRELAPVELEPQRDPPRPDRRLRRPAPPPPTTPAATRRCARSARPRRRERLPPRCAAARRRAARRERGAAERTQQAVHAPSALRAPSVRFRPCGRCPSRSRAA